MSVVVQDYLITPVVPFTTVETISLPVTGAAGTVPVSQGVGGTTVFGTLGSSAFTLPISSPGIGTGSESFGAGSSAPVSGGTALGHNALAGGVHNSVAIGDNSSATGDSAIAIGESAAAAGFTSIAVGAFTSASGDQSLAMGLSSSATKQGSVGIIGSSSGINATAIGGGATVSANGATALSGAIISGLNSIGIGNAVVVSNPSSLVIGAGAIDTASGQIVLGADTCIYNTLFLGRGVASTAPSPFVISATRGSGANVVGSSLTLQAGESTGSAKGGDILLQTSPAGGAGSGLNPFVTIAQFTGDSKIGIFNATPVVKQAGASAAALAAILDANAKSAISALQNALAAYGWVTAPA